MPKGSLRPGRVRIAGVTSLEVYHELLWVQEDLDLPTKSQALDVVLEEWNLFCHGVIPDRLLSRLQGTLRASNGVLHPTDGVLRPTEKEGEL